MRSRAEYRGFHAISARANWRIVFRFLKFDGFNIAVSQISGVIPYLIQAPRFFHHAITLGDVQ